MTETQDVAKRNIDYVIAASQDSDREAREGLASGIRDLFFDGMEDLALTWFRDEGTETVRGRLLEHMAVNVDRATKYKRPVLETYERSSIGSLDRARLEAASCWQVSVLFFSLISKFPQYLPMPLRIQAVA